MHVSLRDFTIVFLHCVPDSCTTWGVLVVLDTLIKLFHFIFISLRYQDENTKASFMVVSCTRWLSIRLDLLSSLFVTIVAVTTMLISNSPGKLMCKVPWLCMLYYSLLDMGC